MRRSTRLGLAAAVLAVVAVIGVYTALWFVAAGRIEGGLARFAQSLHAHNLDLSWRAVRVGGFPLALHIEMSEARLRDRATTPASEVEAPRLSASARPWNPLLWRVAAADGLSGARTLAGGAVARVTARRADGTVAVATAGGATVWLNITEPASEGSVPLAAHNADLWLTIPPHPPRSHIEPDFGVALDVRALNLPAVPAPFANPLDELALAVTVMGKVPAAPLREAAAQWHDAGGTIELNHLAVRWGGLSVTGSGTLALDHDLQPIGAFSGAVEGYDALMSALVTAGRMSAGDARLARLALTMLAKAGPDGRPEIATSFTLQDGAMYLGPVKLGKAPRIEWK